MRDWTAALRPASFRGVRFWVEADAPETGRRVAVHEIAGGERPVTEDMGRRALTIDVSAYVASDTADAEGWALERACAARGAGPLVLPMDPLRLAHCETCARERQRDRAGYVAYSLSFVEAGTGAGAGAGSAGGGLSVLRTVFAAGLAAAAAAMGDAV